MADGDECFKPTSNIADTKSRCKSSGHVNRFDHRPSSFLVFLLRPPPFFLPVPSVELVVPSCLGIDIGWGCFRFLLLLAVPDWSSDSEEVADSVGRSSREDCGGT